MIRTTSVATDLDVPRRSVTSWSVSESVAEDPEPALRRRISHVYSPTLRDAVRDLDGGEQSQLHDVLKNLIGSDHDAKPGFESADTMSPTSGANHPLAVGTRDAIQGFFTWTTPPNPEHIFGLKQQYLEFHRIARLLRIQFQPN
ncbi:hypothetical protein G6031_08680 [Dietzia sp. CQ4]|uniref:hypothetical protein n=1 Tax=Dietzia sp. (strain CQ4) TaxID=370437 RepID=UPI0015FD9F8C|nr:hypothetical protein [Dietzia sp. CQ4]MBB1034463.1 hypothetical protein [Dietzia sp. CQ4]